MKVLVTGATGFIGLGLAEALRVRGHEVVSYDRHTKEVPAVDGVVNLAGETIAQRWTEKAKQRILDSRVETTRHVLSRMGDAKFIVSASATGFYGSRGDEVLDELSSGGKGFLSEVCQAWEGAVTGSSFKGRKAILRIAPVLGQGGGMLTKLLPPFRLGLGGRLGNGRQWMSWIQVEDLIAMFTTLVENSSLEGVFCGVAPEPVTNQDFTKALGGVLHRPTPFPVPRFALKLALGEMSEMLLDSQRVLSSRFQEFPFRFRSIRPALLFSTAKDKEQ